MTREDREIWDDMDDDERLEAYSAALDELAAMTATAEDYRVQACRPDDCLHKAEADRLRAAVEKRDKVIAKLMDIYCPPHDNECIDNCQTCKSNWINEQLKEDGV